MHYYEHHIGDYAQATMHLTFVEDAAYTRLIRKYYADEKPLPADTKAVQRLIGARTKEERQAVETVLQEFFVLEADGWHQHRCDAEIAQYRDGEPEREAKKANESVRLKRHRDERAALFKKLTDAGQHAPWNISISDLRSMVERLTCNAPATPPATATEQPPATAPATPATATHTPDTNHQTPDTRSQPPDQNPDLDPLLSADTGRSGSEQPRASAQEPRRARRTRTPETPLPDGFEISDRVRQWADEHGHADLQNHLDAFVLKARAKGYRYADWDAALMNAIRDNWAGVGNGQRVVPLRGESTYEHNVRVAEEWLRNGNG